MKLWIWFALPVIASLVGVGLNAVGLKPDGSWGWFMGIGIVFALIASYSVNRAQDKWPRDGSHPPFDAFVSLAIMTAALVAAFVMAGLMAVGGLAR